MSKWKIGCGAAAVLSGLLAIPVLLIGSAFVGNAKLEPGHAYADGRVITVFDTYVACFLVEVGGGRWVLVDACMNEDAAPIQAALAAQGATLDDIALLLLTHGHSDHVGGAKGLSGVPVRALAAEIPYLEGAAAYRGPMPSLLGAVDTGIRVRQPLQDGERFSVGDTSFEAFAVPGHTAGSAAYLVHGVLILGDSAGWKTAGELVPAPWVFTDDLDENTSSLRALAGRLAPRASEVDWILPAHTGPAPGLAPLQAL